MLIDGTDRARQAVRQNAFQNVDVIKVTADENLTVPELAAVIEEAHRLHLKVAVHAADKTSIQTAIDAGADSIEHGNEAMSGALGELPEAPRRGRTWCSVKMAPRPENIGRSQRYAPLKYSASRPARINVWRKRFIKMADRLRCRRVP